VEVKLKSRFIKNLIKKISKISNSPLLDFALIYSKYDKKTNLASTISKISGKNPFIKIDALKIVPFYFDLIKRIKSCPIPYITHSKVFYESDFYIKKGVLIPRPETEILVDCAILYCLYLVDS